MARASEARFKQRKLGWMASASDQFPSSAGRWRRPSGRVMETGSIVMSGAGSSLSWAFEMELIRMRYGGGP